MNKFLFFVFCLISLSSFFISSSTLAQEGEEVKNESVEYRIGRVDHERNQLLINDKIYIMPISLGTYIFDSKTRKKTKVNRYALKEGQVVFFSKYIKNQQVYISDVTIFRR